MEQYPVWIRLHPDSVDETLAQGVQARMHDPLWLLGRQWQLDELRHDAGSTPVDVRVEGTSAPLSRLCGGLDAAATAGRVTIKPSQTPLETLVEQEAVSERGLDNLRLRTESGLHLVRMLRAASLPDRAKFWTTQCPFAAPNDLSDDALRRWWELVEGRVPDGAALPKALRAALAAGATPPIAAAEAAVLKDWLTWQASRFDVPSSTVATWDPEHLEYAFMTAGIGSSGERVLAAPEYVEGRLEWFDFEQMTGSLATAGEATQRRSFRIPAPLDFAGMPNPRFWTLEEPSVRFDALDLLTRPDSRPSPVTLMVLDFALSYSDDWFLIPLVLDAWTIFDATVVAITDAFGDTTQAVRPDGRWNMFRLDDRSVDNGLSNLFLAATPAEANEGPAIEELHLLQDEVANVAWGVERIVPHPLGSGIEVPIVTPTLPVAPESGLVWALTPQSPPTNWFPLLPIEIGKLALGVLWSAPDAKPRGSMLADLRAPRRLHQEEVPPEGVQLARRWQSARGIDGSLHFWIGRSKTPRRTDIAPAVRFDLVEWT